MRQLTVIVRPVTGLAPTGKSVTVIVNNPPTLPGTPKGPDGGPPYRVKLPKAVAAHVPLATRTPADVVCLNEPLAVMEPVDGSNEPAPVSLILSPLAASATFGPNRLNEKEVGLAEARRIEGVVARIRKTAIVRTVIFLTRLNTEDAFRT